MNKRQPISLVKAISPPGYHSVLGEVVDLLEQARHGSARAVNALMTAAYWQVGGRIVHHEQHGADRADYGGICSRVWPEDLGKRASGAVFP